MRTVPVLLTFGLFIFSFCTGRSGVREEPTVSADTTTAAELPPDPARLILEKDLLYDNHTLADTYPYKDTTRRFQWSRIRARLATLEYIQREAGRWAILQNYRNRNGEAPLVRSFHRDSYNRVADSLNTERYQGIPLYPADDTLTPVLYGRDGSLVRVLSADGEFFRIEPAGTTQQWNVPRRYIRQLPDSTVFRKALFIDVTNQNIATLERSGEKWLIRSMNPATTGQHRPPYAQETPLGMFVVQEKKAKMFFLVDGTTRTGGFAPYASRFTNGGYIHGIPVNAPRKSLIEYSPTLGTTPRSHMCVRNATSHAEFVYGWAPVNEAVVFVFN